MQEEKRLAKEEERLAKLHAKEEKKRGKKEAKELLLANDGNSKKWKWSRETQLASKNAYLKLQF